MRVYLTSPWIPAEWVRAHGLEARGLGFAENFQPDTPPQAAGVCAWAERVVRFAGAQPEAAVVFTTACDQMRRGYDAARFGGAVRTFLFNLPATQGPAARQLYRAEVARLGQFLQELGGAAPGSDELRRELQQAGAIRDHLRLAAAAADARSLAAAIGEFQDAGRFCAPAAAPATNRVPLALVGGPLSKADGGWFDAIEAAGGRVVLNATEPGERGLGPVFELDGEPFDALVRGYFENIVDVFLRPNTRLYAWLQPRLASRRARGIVLRHFTGCDLWRAEAQTLRETTGLPVLPIEATDPAGVAPREVHRLQALVEMLT